MPACNCFHAPEQHGPNGCEAVSFYAETPWFECECPWDGKPDAPNASLDAAFDAWATRQAQRRNAPPRQPTDAERVAFDREIASIAAEAARLGVPGPDVEEHPDGYDGECFCQTCLSYAAEDC